MPAHRCRLLNLLLGVAAVAIASARLPATALASDLAKLRVLQPAHPRAFFFRAAEVSAANPRVPYKLWEAAFERLMGIAGKVLDEEVPGRSKRNIQFFTRFKSCHPDQLVLLHYNGNARDPRDAAPEFFAGHWLYYNGARVLSDVPAEAGETELRVDRPELFRTGIGRYRDRNDEIGLCRLDERGRPDWRYAEQVQLLAVDLEGKRLVVRRACYGTKPLAFEAGRAYAAAHVTEGPWGRRSHLLWFYNYSTRSPRDRRGRSCAEVLAAELGRRFKPGGELAEFDGIEFDVLHHRVAHGSGRRRPDCNADGQPDSGIFDGINTYGVGVVEFCRRLRCELGGNKLILADGASAWNQRAFGILNGIESEGWPHLSDPQIRDWSGGMNRHMFWRQNGHEPAFSYINHKFVAHGDLPGQERRVAVPFSTHRLVFAAAAFTDSAVCYSNPPQREPNEFYGVWDELRMGRDWKLGWLGRPLGPPVRLAKRDPDLLNGRGLEPADLIDRLQGEHVWFEPDGAALKVCAATGSGSSNQLAAKAADEPALRFRLCHLPAGGPDLFVSVLMRGEPLWGYPAEVARLVWVGLAEPAGKLIRAELPMTAGIRRRGGREVELDADSGATLRYLPSLELGGERHEAYFTHPPYRGGVGYTFWCRDVIVPADGTLSFLTGMGEKSPQRSDGVLFAVELAEIEAGRPGRFVRVFEHKQKASRWQRHVVPLARWAGRRVRIKFVADCGPNDSARADHACWADAWLRGQQGREQITAPARFMSWCNRSPFESGFYFPEIRSDYIDLELRIEGTEPVWIERITAHAHPDVIYREFERGLVLANPSPRPYVLDLGRVCPGRRFRRIRGSEHQDPETNNGEPVGQKVKLQARDALFLVALGLD